MRGMSFLERLLDGVVVKWKSLGEIGEFVRGSGLQKSDFTDSGIGCIHYGQIYTYYGDYAYQTKSFVSSTLATKLRKAQKNDLIIATTSENIEDVCKTLVWLGEEEVCVSGETYIFKHNQNPKYLAYYLKTPNFFDFKKLNRTGTKVIRVHGDRLATFQIPIPPLAIQAEIVRILDTFTELTAELTAELTDRQKQYNYYRDRLLTFEEGKAEWKALGDVCRFINGRAYKQSELLDQGKYPVLRVGNFFTNDNWYYSNLELEEDKYCDRNDLLYAWSASFGPRIWDGDKVIYHYHIWKVVPEANIISKKYLYYFLDWDTNALKEGHGTGSTMMHVSKGSIEKRLVPVPPLDTQARIVAILDKFDTLTNSIREGLPREIALRQQQYEYYRDLLLSFPKAEEGASN